ncbi:hypothetical protein EBH_0050010 [Eimeria brunetti]|uniref:SAG family member n=1 Tax=Eimeria brunetti TaxID=51314 RepID=U6L5G8_9EIME|nr:hypothetical protein EBH_0050010 [Eimeria brunetti]
MASIVSSFSPRICSYLFATDTYLAINLARNGKLPVRINDVETGDNLVTSVKGKIQEKGAGTTDGTCQEFAVKTELKNMFFHTFENTPETSPDYRKVLQEALTKGLSVFTEQKYPKTSKEWEAIWAEEAGASLAHLLGSNSTHIGCAIGSEEYFNGLIARTAQLGEMTPDDLKAPANDGTGTAVFPTILIASLVAMLTAASA